MISSMKYRACLILAFACLGCKEEPEIRRYQVPHEERSRPEPKNVIVDLTSEKQPATRMLVGVLPNEERTWFFKIMGPADDVEANREAFEKLVKSVRFTKDKDKPVTWTAPEKWTEDRTHKDRFATLKIPTKDKPLELSISSLGKVPLLANVNRWRGQVGLPPIGEADLKTCVRTIKLDGDQ